MLFMREAEKMGRKLMSLPRALEAAGGISDSTRRRLPDFPEPVVLSRTKAGRPARIAFVEAEVLAWCEQRIASHRGSAPTAPDQRPDS
jgi:predicted DNA-binding transcriptional regulator AlpA